MSQWWHGVELDSKTKEFKQDVEHFQKILKTVPDDVKKERLHAFHIRFAHDSPVYLGVMDELFTDEGALSDEMCKYIFETYIRPNSHFKFIAQNTVEDYDDSDESEEDWRVELFRTII